MDALVHTLLNAPVKAFVDTLVHALVNTRMGIVVYCWDYSCRFACEHTREFFCERSGGCSCEYACEYFCEFLCEHSCLVDALVKIR